MLTIKRHSLWVRVAVTLLLTMVGMVASAQTFVVVDKQGNRVTYDASKIDKITFKDDPPGFTIHEVRDDPSGSENPGSEHGPGSEVPSIEETSFSFDEVASFSGDPDFLFAHPDTVYIGGESEEFKFQFRSNMEYNYNFGDCDWISFVSPINDTDLLLFKAAMNPMTTQRKGFIAFVSKDELVVDTVWVKQAGKLDSRYIEIDWTKTTLDNFDEESGKAQMTFTGDVPVMGDYDVVLLPKDDSYVIRLIDKIEQMEGTKTVTLTTRQGLMGNLFKGTKFALATEASSKARGDATDYPVYLPTKVEMITEGKTVELFNADRARTRGVDVEKEFVSWEYNEDGIELWSSGVQSLSWDKLNFNIGLKGLFSFDFGDIPFEKVRMGDLQNLKITLEGGFDMEMILKYAVASEVKYEKEWTLKENAIPNLKYTFMVGTIPVYITVGADLMASISLGASGEASVTTGVTASTKVSYGVEWNSEKGLSKIAECEKNLELVGPDLGIQAHAEARATAYPKIEIGIYKVLCPTISPQPYLKAEADGRLVDNQYVAWNAGVSAGIDLGLGLCLDLFFWKKDLGEIDPINVFDLPLVSLPDEMELTSESPVQMLKNNKEEVKYHVTNKNHITGTTYNAPGVLVKFEAEGGELEDEYGYTDKDGNVSAFFTLTDDVKGGKVMAEVVMGSEDEDDGGQGDDDEDEDAIKADDWEVEAIQYRLIPTPSEQTIAKDAESAAVSFKLEQYSSKAEAWTPLSGKTIYFEAKGGSCNASGVTSSAGIATATFTPNDDFTEGSVTGSITLSEPGAWSATETGKIFAETDDDDITDEGLKKAEKQKENVYVVENKKTGEKQERSYVTKWSEWNKTSDFVEFSLEDADADGGTLGMIWGHIPLTMADVVMALTGEQFENTPGAKFGFDVYEGTQLSATFACFTGDDGMTSNGNIKPESKILLRKTSTQSSARTRGTDGQEDYTGDYELLFYLVFQNQTYNYETDQMEYGDDYEVYGRGTMQMHIPHITSFNLKTEDAYVKVGNSTKVNVSQYYEEAATWDWNDVELVGQSTNYADVDNEDLGFFIWNPTTQTLTSIKSNDNQGVILKFALKSNLNVNCYISVETGDGWPYTKFKFTPEEQTMSPGDGYCDIWMEDGNWAPSIEDQPFDWKSVEIDPDSDPNHVFMFYPNNKYLTIYQSHPEAGTYELRFRLKSDHSTGCTMKITIPDNY